LRHHCCYYYDSYDYNNSYYYYYYYYYYCCMVLPSTLPPFDSFCLLSLAANLVVFSMVKLMVLLLSGSISKL